MCLTVLTGNTGGVAERRNTAALTRKIGGMAEYETHTQNTHTHTHTKKKKKKKHKKTQSWPERLEAWRGEKEH